MRRWLIVGAVAVVVVAGALALAMANLSRWLVANHDWLTAQAERALGREVAFDEIGVSLWGGVGARVTGLRIADDPRYADGDFLRAASARITVAVLPALFGRYEVRRVVLREPVVTLIRDADGMNVDSLGTRPKRKRPRPEGARPPRERDERSPLVVVALLDVRDGTLRWIDRRTSPPAELLLDRLHVEAEDLRAGAAITFDVAARLAGAAERNVAVRGSVGPIGDPPVLDAVPVAASVSVRDVDPAVLLRALPDVAAFVPDDIAIAGPVTVTGSATGTLAALALDATADVGGAALAWGSRARKPAGQPCAVTVKGRRDGDTVRFERAELRMGPTSLDVSGTITPGDPLRLDVTVDGTAADLAALGTLVPEIAGLSGRAEVHATLAGDLADGRVPRANGTIALTDVAVRRPEAPVGITGLTTTIQLDGDGAILPPSRFRVAELPMEASASVRDFAAPRVELRASGEAVPLAVAGIPPEKGLPADVVRGVAIDGRGHLVDGVPEGEGTLRSASGVVHGLEYSDLTATIRVRDAVATIDDFGLAAYGGTVRGTARAELHDPTVPRLAVEAVVRGVGLDGLIASQRIEDAQRVSGRLDSDAALTASGLAWPALQRSAAGRARIEIHDGVVHDVNIGDDVLGAVTVPGIASLLPEKLRKKRPDLFATTDTRFDVVRASATIAGETARTDDFLLSAKAFTVRGGGTLDARGRVDFAGTFTAAKGLTADVTSSIREARYIANDAGLLEIPFLLRGRLPKVKAQPDLRIVTQLLERGVLDRGLEAMLGSGKDGKKGKTPEERLRRGLDKLFGR